MHPSSEKHRACSSTSYCSQKITTKKSYILKVSKHNFLNTYPFQTHTKSTEYQKICVLLISTWMDNFDPLS